MAARTAAAAAAAPACAPSHAAAAGVGSVPRSCAPMRTCADLRARPSSGRGSTTPSATCAPRPTPVRRERGGGGEVPSAHVQDHAVSGESPRHPRGSRVARPSRAQGGGSSGVLRWRGNSIVFDDAVHWRGGRPPSGVVASPVAEPDPTSGDGSVGARPEWAFAALQRDAWRVTASSWQPLCVVRFANTVGRSCARSASPETTRAVRQRR